MKLKLGFPVFLVVFLLVFSSCDFLFGDDCECEGNADNCYCFFCNCDSHGNNNGNGNSNGETVFTPNEFELEVFRLTNIERVNNGLPALIWHDTLAFAARAHSEDLMLNNITGHTGSDGSNVGQRIERAGITNLRTWAENCAYGYTTPEAVVAGWMNSDGHRANILNAIVTHLGVGYIQRPQGASARYGTYWTQKFCAFR